ncbi:protein kinase domain-containing protein [Streptomyces sp. enrichment culture]|uniref:serine/threonine-protein kinase n=1 Tax=Streptomyces sp. enrichment culture TaxID=1795815 RepID=UPI003F55ACBF
MVQSALIHDRYRLLDLIGRGGMGEVWRARDESLGRRVAVKCLKPPAQRGDTAFLRVVRERFRREARVAASLQHRGVTVVHDFGDHEGLLYLVMELLEGRNLSQLLEDGERRPLPVADLLDVAEQVAAALAYTHDQGVVHRDLKPANVMRTDDGTVKICDFGIARLAHDIGFTAKLTGTNIAMGTPHYMSPEQIAGSNVDHRSDLYSFGCVLYELATGVPPFKGGDAWSVLVGHRDTPPEPPRSHRPELPVGLEEIILRLLAKEPEERPDDAAELIDGLVAARARLSGQPAGPEGESARPWWRLPWARGMSGGLPASVRSAPSGSGVARVPVLTERWTGGARVPFQASPASPPAGVATVGSGGPRALSASSAPGTWPTPPHSATPAHPVGTPSAASEAGFPGGALAPAASRPSAVTAPPAATAALAPRWAPAANGTSSPGEALWRGGAPAPGGGSASDGGPAANAALPPGEPLAPGAALALNAARAAGPAAGSADVVDVLPGPGVAALSGGSAALDGSAVPDPLAAPGVPASSVESAGSAAPGGADAFAVRGVPASSVVAGAADALAVPGGSASSVGSAGSAAPGGADAFAVPGVPVASAGSAVPAVAAGSGVPGADDVTHAAACGPGPAAWPVAGGPPAASATPAAPAASAALAVLAGRHSAATSLGRLGRWEEAYEAHLAVAAERTGLLGPCHPDTLASRAAVGHALGRLGRWPEALAACRSVAQDRAWVLGGDHPDTLAARHEWGVCLTGLGRVAEARDLYRELAAALTRVLGPAAPETLRALHGLATSLAGLGCWEEALEVHRHVVPLRERVLGPGHPDTLAGRNDEAQCLERLGRGEEAAEVYRALAGT